LLGDLELNGSPGLLLHEDRSRRNAITAGHVADAQRHHTASAQLAVNRLKLTDEVGKLLRGKCS
jgi:hypothetical protein